VSGHHRAEANSSDAETINDIIKSTYVPEMQDVEVDGLRIEPPVQLPWYPGGLAWQVDAPKRVVRKSLPFKTFQRFLVGETEVVRYSPHMNRYMADQQGNLSRQEAVSMIPPLFLKVEPHHRVSTSKMSSRQN
jgi:multisite-specific tRNA:(cytosine-C5)-methyltransferase